MGGTEAKPVFRRGLGFEREMGGEIIVEEKTDDIADGVGDIHIQPMLQHPVGAVVDGYRRGAGDAETDDFAYGFSLVRHKGAPFWGNSGAKIRKIEEGVMRNEVFFVPLPLFF